MAVNGVPDRHLLLEKIVFCNNDSAEDMVWTEDQIIGIKRSSLSSCLLRQFMATITHSWLLKTCETLFETKDPFADESQTVEILS